MFLDLQKNRGASGPAPPDTTPNFVTKMNTLIADYAVSPSQYPLVQGGVSATGVSSPGAAIPQLNSWQNQQGGLLSWLRAMAQAVTIDMVNAYATQANLTLQTAFQYLITNVFGPTGSGYYFTGSTVALGVQTNGVPTPTGAYAATGNSGPIIVLSKLDGKGFQLDNILAETITFLCTRDAQSGGATKWQETINFAGLPLVSDRTSYLWPGGSGCSGSFNCVDANQNNSGGNLLVNGEFLNFTTANVPDNWILLTGAAGTNIASAATGYNDAQCLEMIGADGTTLTSIKQIFNTPSSTALNGGGTPANLLQLPDVPFGVNFWVKTPVIPAAGQLQCNLIDGNNAIINDDAGNANTFTADLTSAGLNTTAWANVNGVFRMPSVDPVAPVGIRLWQPTGHAITSGKNIYIDRVAMTQMRQLYGAGPSPFGTGGGPFGAVFAGNVAPLLNDSWTVANTNTMGNFLRAMLIFFAIDTLGLRVPTAGSGTAVADDNTFIN